MIKFIFRLFSLFLFSFTLLACTSVEGKTKKITLNLTQQEWALDDKLSTTIYSYNKTMPGAIIKADIGDILEITGKNELPITTNIHWHGIRLPVDQDGPDRSFAPGDTFSYKFPLKQTGTYWYHSHTRPVRDQVGMGFFAPLIINAPEDKLYDTDSVVVIQDLSLDPTGKRLDGPGVGHLERLGNLIAINGKVRKAIKPLEIQQGDVNKVRILNASTAAYYNITFPFEVLVTHEDGAGLGKPFKTKIFTLGPAERVDVEMIAPNAGNYTIQLSLTDRMYKGKSYGVKAEYGILVKENTQNTKTHIFQGQDKEDISSLIAKKPDYILNLGSRMKGMGMMNHNMDMSNMKGMDHTGHNMSSMNNDENAKQLDMASMMSWTINGKEFPNVPPMDVKVGDWVKVRFINNDMHAMDHPMHLHGTHFRVLAIKGGDLSEVGLERDVINVPHKGSVDIAFKLDEAGMWMLHCHILDHEDGGMMMVVNAK